MDIISHAVLPYLLGSFFRIDRKLLAAFVIGGVAPDLDVFIIWLALIFPSPDLLLVHRGITHSPIFGFLIALAAMLLISRPPGRDIFRRWTGIEFSLSWPVAALALAGVLMHLFLDYIITKGVPLLYPLDTVRFSAELLFHYEITIPVCSVGIALWLLRGFFEKKSVSRKTNNKLLALFLIVLLAAGGLRVEGKERALALDNYGDIAEDLEGDFEVFPDWGLFQWNILNKNESSFQVYSYDFLNNKTSYLASYPRLHVELDAGDPESTSDLNFGDFLKEDRYLKASMSRDEVSDLEETLHLADSHPKVVLFRWRACAVAINASRNNGSWSLEYYDPVGRAGMVNAPIWMRERVKQSSSMKVRVEGDQAYVIGQDLKDLYNLNGERYIEQSDIRLLPALLLSNDTERILGVTFRALTL
ncbi:MAG TPA: metal-dependent hydrolase [Methanotrichaceae archaeon]|nr:metal-dependent hydrolase [Methanotrichaceae archaeon]